MKVAAKGRPDARPGLGEASWLETTLGSLGKYWNGRGFKKREWRKTGRQIIRIQDLTRTGSRPNYYQGEAEERHVVRAGDLLVSWAATLGVFVWDGPEAVLNQHIFKVESSIEKTYHRWLIESVLDRLKQDSHGSGMVHITRGRFDRTSVLVPPREFQAAIAAEIEAVVSRITHTSAELHRIANLLRFYRAAVLSAAFAGDLTGSNSLGVGEERFGLRIPRGWSWLSIGTLSEKVEYGTSTKTDSNSMGVPVLRMRNLRFGKIELQDLRYLPRAHREFPRLFLERGDVLFNRTNSAELVGQAAVYTGEPAPCSFASYLIRVRLRPGYLPELLSYFLLSPYGRVWARSVVSQQVGQANINGTKLKALMVPVPPADEQRAVLAVIEERLAEAAQLERTLTGLYGRLPSLRAAAIRTLLTRRLEESTAV